MFSGAEQDNSESRPKAVANLRSLDSRRLGARLIDAALILAVSLLLSVLLSGIVWLAVLLWAAVTYFFLCEATTGQTIGKGALGLRVVHRDGGPAKANSVAARNVIRIFEEPFLALITLVASGKRRQRIGDFAGETTVGRAAESARPRSSRLRFVYPAIWAVGGLLFALAVSSSNQGDSSPLRVRTPVTPRIAAATYRSHVQETCDFDERTLDGRPRPSILDRLGEELDLSGDIATVPPPSFMFGVRLHLLRARWSVDRAALWGFRLVRRSAHPNATYTRVVLPRIRPLANRSANAFVNAGLVCGIKPP